MIKTILKSLIKDPISNKLRDWGFLTSPQTASQLRPQFKRFGKSWLREPVGLIKNPDCISIGNGVEIERGVDFEVSIDYPLSGQKFTPELIIGDGVCIRKGTIIYCCEKVTIGNNVLIGRNAVICDVSHDYEDVTRSVAAQTIPTRSVEIGEDSFLGHGVIILQGVKVGKHCVVGAGAVVTHDLPDYSVAVGNPARVVKQYDAKTQQWGKVQKSGKPETDYIPSEEKKARLWER